MSWVSRSGTQGKDHSANAASVPLAGYALLITIGANPKRNFIEVQNQSGNMIQVVRDDPPPAGAGANITSILLASGGGIGTQGGNWTSDTFKGRLQIYTLSAGDQVSAYED